MTLKKWLISMVTVALASAAFAFPAPPDDTDPLAQAMEQYTAQIEQMNKTFDQKVLPPLKGLLKIAEEFGNSTQTELTPEQEQAWNQHQAAITKALTDLVTPVVEQADYEAGQRNVQTNFNCRGPTCT